MSEEVPLARQMSHSAHFREQDSSDEIRYSVGDGNNLKLLDSEDEQTVTEIDPESGTRFVYYTSQKGAQSNTSSTKLFNTAKTITCPEST